MCQILVPDRRIVVPTREIIHPRMGANQQVMAAQKISGGGTPTGNAWTIVSYAGAENATTTNSPAGSIGDILVIYLKWEGTGVLSGISGATSGAGTLRGTQIDHANGDLHCRFVTIVTTTASAEVLTPAYSSGTAPFKDWAVWRVSATGTKDFSQANGGTGTSTSPSSGSITSATLNGLACVGLGVYGATTPSSRQVAGNTASNNRAMGGSSSVAWDYTHTAQISGAGTCTLSPSIEWVCSILDCSAQ